MKKFFFFCWQIALTIGVVWGFVTCQSLVDRGANRLLEPRRYELGQDFQKVIDRPESWGLTLETFVTKTADGLTLPCAWVRRADSSHELRKMARALAAEGLAASDGAAPRGTILMLHGLNSRKEHLLGVCRWFVTAGYQCVIYDSRGHGEAMPSHVTYGAREVSDALAVLAEARRQARKTLGPLGIYGYSMGGAVALQTLPWAPEIQAAVTLAAFAQLQDVLDHQAKSVYRGALRPLMPWLHYHVEKKAQFNPKHISPLHAVERVKTPIFLIHGARDQVVPVDQAEKLYRAIGPERAIYRRLEKTAHHQIVTEGGPDLMIEIVRFYHQHLQTSRPEPKI